MRQIAIIGAGPGGLSAAKLLSEAGIRDIAIFEADARVGGKSFTVHYGGSPLEMGTCYATFDHALTNRWMREVGIHQTRLGKQVIDGKPLKAYLTEGPGRSLMAEGVRYLRVRSAFMKDAADRPDDPEVRAQCALSVDDWLAKHAFTRLRRVMLRTVTLMGYGYLNEVSALQALRWSSPGTLLAGATGQMRWPREGWSEFWRRLAQPFDVRLSSPVIGVERDGDGVTVTTPSGSERFAQVIVSVPLDRLGGVMDLTEDEAAVRDAMTWQGYAVTNLAVDDWFTLRDHFSNGLSAGGENGAPIGALLGARVIPLKHPVDGRRMVYQTGQIAGPDVSDAALLDEVRRAVPALGGTLSHVLMQKVWTYFPRYSLEALADGLLGRMQRLQGENRTWWTGATFSHEAVSHICQLNASLTPRIAKAAAA